MTMKIFLLATAILLWSSPALAQNVTNWRGHPVEMVAEFDPITNTITFKGRFRMQTYVEDYENRATIAIFRRGRGDYLIIRPPRGQSWTPDDFGPEKEMVID